jgi:hypothetical protein
MEASMNAIRKTLTAAVAALVVASGTLATVGSAEAGQRHGRHYNRGPSVAPVIAGIIGGLALGAIAASASRRAYAYDSGYRYAPAPVYRGHYASSGFGDDYGAHCFIQKRRVFDDWGNYVGKRKVRVCQ